MPQPSSSRAPLGLVVAWALVLPLPGVALAQPVALGARVERDGVSVQFVAGAEVNDVATDSWRATVQRVRDGEAVASLSRSATYRGRRDPGRRTRVQVCGRDAERVVLEHEEIRATPAFFRDGHVEHGPESVTPATTEIRIELEHRGLPVWISWTARRDRRTALRAIEDALFASIQCSSGPTLGDPVVRYGVGIPFLRDSPVVDAARGVARQAVTGADVVITVERGAAVRVPGERFLIRVCDRQVDYASRARGDRTVSEVRVPHAGSAVRVSWSVPTARRAALKWLEDAFFAAITCPAGGR